jgi:GNAT superfamily N-acetyltransferase
MIFVTPESSTEVHIRPCTFDEILPIWSQKLWPGRESAIEPTSVISEEGNLSLDPGQLCPWFWIAENERHETIGVVSGFKTSPKGFRSRGIWVAEPYRRKGFARKLMGQLREQARQLDCHYVWSMARATSKDVYLSLGFQIYGETSAYEFGPHYLVRLRL